MKWHDEIMTVWLKQHKLRLIFAIVIIVALIVYQQSRTVNQTVQTYPLTTGSIKHVVTASGNISSAGTLDVYSNINGVLTEMYVQNGQTVDVDTPLFSIVSTASEQDKAAAKASYLLSIDEYNSAEQNQLLYQAQLEQTREAVLGKADGLDDYLNQTADQDNIDKNTAYSQDWSARKLFDNAEKKYIDSTQTLSAKSQNITAKKSVYEATLNQIVKSTVAGTVANINPQIGDEVSILSPTNTQAQPVLTLSNFNTYTVQVTIGENDIYRVALGQPATVIIDSISDTILNGTVTKVDSIGTVNNGLVTYIVAVELHGVDVRMRAGMTAKVDIVTEAQEQALLVPNAALIEGTDGPVAYVQSVAGSNRYIERPVQVGIKDAQNSEVLSGLTGSEVLLDPLSR